MQLLSGALSQMVSFLAICRNDLNIPTFILGLSIGGHRANVYSVSMHG